MSFKTRVYKTMRGYLKAIGHNYESAEKFFSGRVVCRTAKHTFYAVPSDLLRADVAQSFERFHWSRTNGARLNALMNGTCADFSFLQCFYVGMYGDREYFGNSLSGDAYDYCKRMFTKSAY